MPALEEDIDMELVAFADAHLKSMASFVRGTKVSYLQGFIITCSVGLSDARFQFSTGLVGRTTAAIQPSKYTDILSLCRQDFVLVLF